MPGFRRGSWLLAMVAAVALVVSVGAPVGAAAGPAAASDTPAQAATSFVTAVYHDFLDRAPDDAGLAFWVTTLESGGSRFDVVRAITHSTEFAGDTVTSLYHELLDRDPDQGGLAFWQERLASGSASREDVTIQMLASSEYYDKAGATATSWVRSLYREVLGRSTVDDPNGVAYWAALSTENGRAWVAAALLRSHEARVFRVDRIYQQLLGHAPDPTGREYWAGVLLARGSLLVGEQIAASSEYLRRAETRYPPTSAPSYTWQQVTPESVSLPWAPAAVTPDGTVVGTNMAGDAVICATPCTTPRLLPLPSPQYGEAPNALDVRGISPEGQIWGTAWWAGYGQPVVWPSASSPPVPLTQVGNPYGRADVTLVAGGKVYGTVDDGNGDTVGVIWPAVTASATPEVLALPDGYTKVTTVAVLPSGVQVGYGTDASGALVGLGWTSATDSFALPLPPGYEDAHPFGATPDGHLWGNAVNSAGFTAPLEWAAPSATAQVRELQMPAGVNPELAGIMPDGEVYGSVEAHSGTLPEGLVWSSTWSSAQPTILMAPSGVTQVHLAGITTTGAVYGTGIGGDGQPSALSWSPQAVSGGEAPAVLPGPSVSLSSDVVGVTAEGTAIGNSWFLPDGVSRVQDVTHPVAWTDVSEPPRPLPLPDGHISATAEGVSPQGQVFGEVPGSQDGESSRLAVVWPSPSEPPVVLPTPADYAVVRVVGVSDAGEVVGTARDQAGNDVVLVWSSATDRNSPVSVVAAPAGYSTLSAAGVAADGTVAATAEGDDGASEAVTFAAGSPTQLMPLPVPTGDTAAAVTDVAPDGTMVGMAQHAPSDYVVVTWTFSNGAWQATQLLSDTIQEHLDRPVISPAGVVAAVDDDGGDFVAVWASSQAEPVVVELPGPPVQEVESLTAVAADGGVSGLFESSSRPSRVSFLLESSSSS